MTASNAGSEKSLIAFKKTMTRGVSSSSMKPTAMHMQAYAVLSDAQQRQAYNARLQEQLQDDLDDYTGRPDGTTHEATMTEEEACSSSGFKRVVHKCGLLAMGTSDQSHDVPCLL